MIAHLNKNYETVEHRENSHLRIYNNAVCEYYPPHWHNDLEIIHISRGNLHVRCQANDYYMKEGDILFICPSAIHEIYAEPEGQRFYIQANMSGFPFLTEIDTVFSMINPAIFITPDTFPSAFHTISESVSRIHTIYFGGSVFQPSPSVGFENQQNQETTSVSLPFMAETEIYSFLLAAIASIGHECQKGSMDEESPAKSAFTRNQAAMQESCKYIAEHFSEAITLESVAGYSGFSKFHFERIFKQFTNMTFYQYVTKVRLAYAQQLLEDHSIPVTEVALRSGFSGGSTFTRAFRQATGFTPSDFRQINEQIHPLENDSKFRHAADHSVPSGDVYVEHFRAGSSEESDT